MKDFSTVCLNQSQGAPVLMQNVFGFHLAAGSFMAEMGNSG